MNEKTEKKLDKIAKILGKEAMERYSVMPAQALEQALILAEKSIAEAKKDVEATDQYGRLVLAKEDMKDLNASLRESCKIYRAKIEYALMLLDEKGK